VFPVPSPAHHPVSGVKVYRRLFAYVKPYWLAFAVSVLAMALLAATATGFAAIMKPLLDGSFVAKDPAVIRLVPLLLIGLFVARGIAGFVSEYCINWVGRNVVGDVRRAMFQSLLGLPARFYDANSSGQLLSKLVYDVEQVAQASTSAATVLVRDTLTVLGLIIWMFYLNALLAAVFVIAGPLIVLLIRYVNQRFRRISTRLQDSMGDITHVAEEVIQAQRVVKVFGGQRQEMGQFDKANQSNRRLNMKLSATSASSSAIIQVISACALAAIIFVATLESMLAAVSVGTFMSMVAAMVLMMGPMKRVTSVNSVLQRGIAAAQSIFALLDTDVERDTGTQRIVRAQGAIAYQQVNFDYGKGPVLRDISFNVHPGQTVALVGRSGSGKSTLVNLLPRFYDVVSGRITLDGQDIRALTLESLRDQIALVSQEVILFNDTIANNIAYGKLAQADEQAIIQAAEAAYAMEFIRDLPQGLNTLVGENGVLLSGGQRQRIAIARALLKDAPVLILDEATSSLDSESERYIQAALERLMRRRTTLVIAHRLSTIERADLILVLHEGRIVESGGHAGLLAQNGHYAALHRMQFHDPAQPQHPQAAEADY